jgi:phytoene desaturase
MHAIPKALAAAAIDAGVTIRYDADVERVEVLGDRATAVHVRNGDRIVADAVVLTADLPVAFRELLPPRAAGRLLSARLGRQRYSPSCFLMLAGSSEHYPKAAHHTISFGRAWRRTFDEIIDRGELMSDPSLLVTCATGFGESIEVEQLTTPADWRARGMERGAPFAASHTFGQTGPFRAPNLAPGLSNVVMAGSGTVPGVGVPMVLISGRLAAERIHGPKNERGAQQSPRRRTGRVVTLGE